MEWNASKKQQLQQIDECVWFVSSLKQHLIRCEVIPRESFVSFVHREVFLLPKNTSTPKEIQTDVDCEHREEGTQRYEWEKRRKNMLSYQSFINEHKSFRQREGMAWNHEISEISTLFCVYVCLCACIKLHWVNASRRILLPLRNILHYYHLSPLGIFLLNIFFCTFL